MKIGVLTFHRAHNYGAVLQCYALQEVLKCMGHSVEVIDYRQPAIEDLYSVHWIPLFKSMVFNPVGQMKYCIGKLRRSRKFNSFRTKYLSLSRPCAKANVPKYDAYIIGSDQLWVPELTGGVLDDVYSGNLKCQENSRVIGYAISTNVKSLRQIGGAGLNKIVANFSALSFREKMITDFVGIVTNNKFRTVLDPTLLADSNIWNNIDNTKWKNRKYILVYHLPSRFENLTEDSFYKQVKEIADREKCDIISLYPMKYSIEDFVSLFRYAKGVITTSFHAIVFSLVFERRLMYVMTGDAYDVRCVDLLESLSANEAIVGTCFENEQWPVLDFNVIRTNLEMLRKESEEYLIDSLS